MSLRDCVKRIAPSARYLKQASLSPSTVLWSPGENKPVAASVAKYLAELEAGGEAKVMQMASDLDQWPTGKNVLLSTSEIKEQIATLSSEVKADIDWQIARIKRFAEAQKSALCSFEMDMGDGIKAGQKIVPIQTVGCYVPGGRFSHVSSASMTIATAKVAGVETIVATSPPMKGTSTINPATLYAMETAGADYILSLGGVQAIGSLAFGLFTGCRADIIVGPGNSYVAEAKKLLFGKTGIDIFAGPTEVLILADQTADPWLVAVDLVSQAEHGFDSPAWLISTDKSCASEVLKLIPKALENLARVQPQTAALRSWEDYGEIIVVDNMEEAVKLSDHYAPEHLQVFCDDLQLWHDNLRNYGSLFLGEETCVTYGDKCSGPNSILPTKGGAKYSAGLSVHKFLKALTFQKSDRLNAEVPKTAARISRLEGMEGHARSCDARLTKYF